MKLDQNNKYIHPRIKHLERALGEFTKHIVYDQYCSENKMFKLTKI